MSHLKKAGALASGLVAALSVAAVGQQPAATSRPGGATLVVPGNINWKETSDVAARREGVIKQIEFDTGDRIEKGQPIGYLHDDMAKLTVTKAKVAAESNAAVKKAQSQRQISMVQLAIKKNLAARNSALVTYEEMELAKAEVMVADSMVAEAEDNQKLARAEQALAEQALAEHVITAPFTGYVTDKLKSTGEAVQANEPVVRIGRTDELRFVGYLPLESAEQVRIGDIVEVQPVIEEADLPIERLKFQGKVTSMSREVEASLRATEIQVHAVVQSPDNPGDQLGIGTQLMAGMKGQMTIHLSGAAAPRPAPAAAVPVPGVRTSATTSPRTR